MIKTVTGKADDGYHGVKEVKKSDFTCGDTYYRIFYYLCNLRVLQCRCLPERGGDQGEEFWSQKSVRGLDLQNGRPGQ